MPGKFHIIDPKTGIQAEVVDGNDEVHALAVATRPLKTYTNEPSYFTNDTYGVEMAQEVSFGGTPVGVFDGEDTVLWTGTTIVGNATDFDFNSTDVAQSGSQSFAGVESENGDVAQFASGSSIDLSNYVAVTGYMYITGWSTAGTKSVDFFGFDTGTGLQVGDLVNIGDYVDTTTFNVWQKFTIPLSDMGLSVSSIDAFRVRTVDIGSGAPPNYYLDTIQIEQTGTSLEYTLRPDKEEWLHVHALEITMIDEYGGTLADSTMPNLAYNQLLGVTTLPNGVQYQRIIDDEVQFSLTIKDTADIMRIPNTELVNTMSDGTNTLVKFRSVNTEPIILKPENDDYLRLLVTDDLSGLISLRVLGACKSESRT